MMTMTRAVSITLVLLAVGCGAVGCGASVDLSLPDRFAVLEPTDRPHDYNYQLHATTPDGVVVGVKILDHRIEGSLAFWSEAITRRLRDENGYELLTEEDTTAATGEAGHTMRFGRDLSGHAYRFTVTVFVSEDHIWLVEAGGREEAFIALEPDIERSVRAIRL